MSRGLLIDDKRSVKQAIAIVQRRYQTGQGLGVDVWDVARDLDGARKLLKAFQYQTILVDHDLGDPRTDGSHALAWLAGRWLDRAMLPLDRCHELPDYVYCVSSNPAALAKVNGWARDIAMLKKDYEEIAKDLEGRPEYVRSPETEEAIRQVAERGARRDEEEKG